MVDLGSATGITSLIVSAYLLMRFGFRVEELWGKRERLDQLEKDVAVMKSQMNDVHGFLFHRAEAEARVKGAVYERE